MAFFRSNDNFTSARFLAEASLAAQASSAFNGVLIWLPLATILFGIQPGIILSACIVLTAYSCTGVVSLLVFGLTRRRHAAADLLVEDRSEPTLYAPAE